MTKIIFFLLVSAVIRIQDCKDSSGTGQIHQTQGPVDTAEFRNFIDSLINTQFSKEHIPGGAFVFVKDGKIFYMKGYGISDIERNTKVDPEKTIFRIGSISKVFTADALLQLADRKQLDLRKDVNNYLQEIKVPSGFSQPITTEHLLTHSAGLDEIRPGTQVSDSASVQPFNTFLRNKLIRLWDPGKIIMYSTYGITLGGALVEDISKKNFEDFLSENIWKPLHMQRTNINVPASLKPDVAMGYEYRNGINQPQSWEWYHTTPASSINSTAEDMAHWMIAHLNQGQYKNNRLMSPAMMSEMLKHHQGMHPAMYGMAYGFFEEYHNDLRFLYHGGNMAGFNSNVVLMPDKNAGFFFVSHHEGSNFRDYLQWAILERYYKNESTRKVPQISGDSTGAAKFAGQYKYNVYCHTCETQARTLLFTLAANKDGTLQLNNRKWIESSNKLLFVREDGKSQIAFKQDTVGQITHMYFGGTWTFEKIR